MNGINTTKKTRIANWVYDFLSSRYEFPGVTEDFLKEIEEVISIFSSKLAEKDQDPRATKLTSF